MKPTFLPLLFASLGLFSATLDAAEKWPNVIFILTDDQGWNDAHFGGHLYVKTPNLDQFASQSTWLRQFYVAATVCSPSRTAFMTAHSPARHFVHGHFATHEQNVARSMPDWLDPKVPTDCERSGARVATRFADCLSLIPPLRATARLRPDARWRMSC